MAKPKPETPPAPVADDTPEDDVPAALAAEAGVGAEYVDPEPDEESTDANGGDLVQLVRTGWVRFVIAGHGRVRLRPPRFGELRHIMVAYEAMVDEIQERSHATQALADNLNAEITSAIPVDGTEPAKALTPDERHELLASVTLRSRQASRELTRWREDQYLQWWAMVQGGDGDRFSGLGVSGEKMPDLDAMPIWLTVPALANSVLAHWQAVPLDRGKQ